MKIQNLSDTMHQLVVAIWGKKHVSRGYNWVHAKFGNMNQERWEEGKYKDIITCLTAKQAESECPVHHRVHVAVKSI